MTTKPCKDCTAEGISTRRPIVAGPGPRCATHARVARQRAARLAHERRIVAGYRMAPEFYHKLYSFQGGHCAICERATGKARRLAVDHDHKAGCDHPADQGCPQCWRGLLCKRCNALIGYFDAAALARALTYLMHPPAQRIRIWPAS